MAEKTQVKIRYVKKHRRPTALNLLLRKSKHKIFIS